MHQRRRHDAKRRFRIIRQPPQVTDSSTLSAAHRRVNEFERGQKTRIALRFSKVQKATFYDFVREINRRRKFQRRHAGIEGTHACAAYRHAVRHFLRFKRGTCPMTFGIDKRMLKKGFNRDQYDVSLTCRNVTKRTQEGPVVADRAFVS
ncbi:hypothetical protein [Dyella koreensis]|uniref:Transposase n=1 Tax=Dyella koreensis TaxID=311235 RepID=A0ABW8K2X9_9GAMM